MGMCAFTRHCEWQGRGDVARHTQQKVTPGTTFRTHFVSLRQSRPTSHFPGIPQLMSERCRIACSLADLVWTENGACVLDDSVRSGYFCVIPCRFNVVPKCVPFRPSMFVCAGNVPFPAFPSRVSISPGSHGGLNQVRLHQPRGRVASQIRALPWQSLARKGPWVSFLCWPA